RKRQLILLAELAVGFRRLGTYPRDVEPRSLNRRVQITDRAGLLRTSRREIRRVKVEDQRPRAQQRAQRHHLPGVIRQREFRCSPTYIQHSPTPRREGRPLDPLRLWP